MSEFALIDLIRQRVASGRGDVALGIGDDAALLDVPAGMRLVACTDSMVEGVHFLRGTAPADLGWKALAVNLSDLAAMGAEPAWALLALTLPDGGAEFVERFAEGFGELAGMHGVALVGGDTTQGPLAMTATALGFVPHDAALKRAGARAGDAVFVTGTLGDAAGALRLSRSLGESHPPQSPFLRKGEEEPRPLLQEGGRRAAAGALRLSVSPPVGEGAAAGWAKLRARLERPRPRAAAGVALRGIANACIDVSDGLLADLGHVCASSGVGAEIAADALPASKALREAFDSRVCRQFALAGGDDYELCFTAPDARAHAVAQVFAGLGLRVTRIGRIVAGSGVRVLDAQGNVLDTPPHAGWEHFAR